MKRVPLLLLLLGLSESQQPCELRNTGANGAKVCVCNSTYCDTIPRPEKVPPPEFLMYTSNREGLRFEVTKGKFETGKLPRKEKTIFIDHSKMFQTIVGFGGAFTDSVGINIKSLNESAQNLLLRSYFSQDGIEYSLCRVPIGGTDFSTHRYTYDDTKYNVPDQNLQNFSLAKEDYELKIYYIYKARELNPNLKLFGSTWGAPAWMKTNNQTTGKGYIKKEFYQTWANYFIKFLEAYKKQGVDFWGITTQNEPSLINFASNAIMTVGWKPADLARWVGEFLGPTIKKSNFSDVKIMIIDDQKPFLPWYANMVLQYKETRDFVYGIAIHWYFQNVTPLAAMVETHNKYPEKTILSTEACSGFKGSTGVSLGSWEHGENYSTDIIEDLISWVAAWVDWNMVLNLQGGPTFINNTVDSPIAVDAQKGEFYKQPMFYHMGHFSKFIPPGSIIVESRADFDKKVTVVAAKRPDGGVALVILNKKNEDVNIAIRDSLMGTTRVQITERSINTLLYYPRQY